MDRAGRRERGRCRPRCWPVRRRCMSPGSSWRFRRPGRRVAFWLIAGGALFAVGVCLGNAITDLPAVAGSASAWLVLLVAECATNLSAVTAIGLIGLFPTGVAQSRGERAVLRATAVAAVLIPVALMASSPDTPGGIVPGRGARASSALCSRKRFGPVEPVLAALQFTFAAWIFLGPILLYLRYRRSAAPGPSPDPVAAGRHGERADRLRRAQRRGDLQLGYLRDGQRLGALDNWTCS